MSEIRITKSVFNQMELETISFLIADAKVKEGEIISLIIEDSTTELKKKVLSVKSHKGLSKGYKLIILERLKRNNIIAL